MRWRMAREVCESLPAAGFFLAADPDPVPPPRPPAPSPLPPSRSLKSSHFLTWGLQQKTRPAAATWPGSVLGGTQCNPTGHTLNMLVFLHRVILWCSAINYCYTTIINNFLNENDSVDLRCILIIRVKHNYTAALSWHVDSFRAQFCFNTLIM